MGTMVIRLSVVFLSSAVLAGCIHRAPSLRMLDARAEYDDAEAATGASLKLSSRDAIAPLDGAVPVRTPPKTANIWIHPHETPTKEYFWGGWITTVIEGDRWELIRPKDLPPEGSPVSLPAKKKNRKKKGANHG